MPHFIQHIVEPDELLLSWQAPGNIHRMRRFIGRVSRTDDSANLMYLHGTPEFEEARRLGFRGYPGFSLKQAEHSDVLPIFMRRLPPRSRTDIRQYVQSFGIEDENMVSDFALLGYSGGRLPGDDFTFIHPFTNASPPVELWIEACGYRFHKDHVPFDLLELGSPVDIVPESDNSMDPEAVALNYHGSRMGYLNRGLAPQFRRWLGGNCSIKAFVERKNGSADRPLVIIYAEVHN